MEPAIPPFYECGVALHPNRGTEAGVRDRRWDVIVRGFGSRRRR